MTLIVLKPFQKQYNKLPANIQKKCDRQLKLLTEDMRHPSLRARKMVNHENVWEARIDIHHRFTFSVTDDALVLRAVGTHEIYRNP